MWVKAGVGVSEATDLASRNPEAAERQRNANRLLNEGFAAISSCVIPWYFSFALLKTFSIIYFLYTNFTFLNIFQ